MPREKIHPGGMGRPRAEEIALSALGWLVANDELRDVFLGSTGLSPEELRQRAGDEDLLVSVLEFVTMDDAWVLGWSRETGHPPEAAMTAHAVLAGTARTHWT
ncbi:DUF3572 domain-containing protein [Wenxinia saemankumensis]|uniref:DUF3572 domain-containing protein n=1 Tax=Wenxinia saemankumensis TaxID=1447782 RepID=A0A1M6CSU9_9RHOB|nr:DUF3572 domain-containing protein [Wenxinia saemankumensis]SHI64165.1 Protein of unknown function [Wenxinia saemankumensis]